MFFCNDIAEYLALPIRKRTNDLRNEAYYASYTRLIEWWEACLTRNYETPTLRSDKSSIDIPATIKELRERRDTFTDQVLW